MDDTIGSGEGEGTYELSAVDEQPQLANQAEVARAFKRNYPPLLRDAGVTGTVTLRFRVAPGGSVDPECISVENTTHEAFGEPAQRIVQRMRFRPARVAGEAVPVWLTLPLTFCIEA
jgi:TonB family protein